MLRIFVWAGDSEDMTRSSIPLHPFLPAAPSDFIIADAEAKVMSVKLRGENMI